MNESTKLAFDYAESTLSNVITASKQAEVNGMISVKLLEVFLVQLQEQHKNILKA